jgi:hypothetical protein
MDVKDDGKIFQLTLATKVAGRFAEPMIRQAITYRNQPDFLAATDGIPTDKTNNNCLVYLDVWERHLTWVEDESIREVGLGGPDTATRAKVVWQIKTNPNVPPLTGDNNVSDPDWRTYVTALQPADPGLLRARVRPEATSTDPCITSPKSSYLGAENQLYRVEVHSGSLDEDGTAITPTFKWSRENGSVVFPISKLSGAQVTVENLGRDSRLGLKVADYVEVVDDDYALQDRADPPLQVMDIDRAAIVVTLSGAPNGPIGHAPLKHPLLRRWDANAANIVEATSADDAWLDLEDGIQIQFQPEGTYRTGDYWLIPARVATGDVEWPKLRDAQGKLVLDERGQPQPVALPPHGVEHHYAPLAVIGVDHNGTISAVTDLRRKFSLPAA